MEFPFPFKPYDVQTQLMQKVFDVIEEKKIGILESPTGTGKSLSLIVGTLTWLLDYYPEHMTESDGKKEVDANDWVTQFAMGGQKREWIERRDAHIKLKAKMKSGQIAKRRKRPLIIEANSKSSNKKESKEDDDSNFLISWEAEPDDVRKLMRQIDMDDAKIAEDREYRLSHIHGVKLDPDNLKEETPKLIFASRTHSQLAQIVKEVKRTVFSDRIRIVSLGSRRNLCIHPQVRKIKNSARMSEKCMEIRNSKAQKKKAKKTITIEEEEDNNDNDIKEHEEEQHNGCVYLNDDQYTLRNHILTDIMDIESITEKGEHIGTCPYYATRKAIDNAHMITLPYSSLIHKTTRESLHLSVKNNIVIIDEAHNLIEAINSAHTVSLSLSVFVQVESQVAAYIERYQNRLKPSNLILLNELLFVIKSCGRFLMKDENDSIEEPNNNTNNNNNTNTNQRGVSSKGIKVLKRILPSNDFIFQLRIESVNLFKLEKFIVESKLVEKLSGFMEKYESYQMELFGGNENNNSPSLYAMYGVRDFLSALTNENENGRIVVQQIWKMSDNSSIQPRIDAQSTIQFVMLNPEVYFSEIVKEARSVLLVGGTMQPFEHFAAQLFPSYNDRLSYFSCEHVVPPENLKAFTLSKGPNQIPFHFTYQTKNNENIIIELGQVMVNICNVVPGGIVCFFTSYAYEEKVCRLWEEKGILQRIRKKKDTFREPRKANEVDLVWAKYAESVEAAKREYNLPKEEKKSKQGGFITCVIGGKMSEGINFSDDLARCVFVIGMPYPNGKDPVLIEKMNYLNNNIKNDVMGCDPGNAYYQNLCMRAVNQSIGRSIRHISDYATIVLVDKRYENMNVEKQLPEWIRNRLIHSNSFSNCFKEIATFFKEKKNCSN